MSKSSAQLILALLILSPGHLPAAEIPSTPKALLAALPRLPAPEWKVTESTGKTAYTSWLISEASRKYQNAETGQTVAITIRDTGSHPSEVQRFQNITPIKFPHLVRGVVNGRPSQILRSETSTTLDTLIDGRLILTVRCDGFEQKEAEKWIESHIDFPALAQIPRSGVTALPQEVPIISIDELRPEANRSSTRPAYAAAHDEERRLEIEKEEQLAQLTPEQRRAYEEEKERLRQEQDRKHVERFLKEVEKDEPVVRPPE